MKKLTFRISSPKDSSVVSLIKEINKISCRFFIDMKNGLVSVENVNDLVIEDVIDLVDNCYTILNVDIDNTFDVTDEIVEGSANLDTTETEVEETANPDTTETTVESDEETAPTKTDEVVAEKQPTILEPQTEDDLIIKKVEFENEYVENRINSFLKTAYWALYNKRATEKDIGDYIFTCLSEISMRYSSKPIIEFSIGDIVDVNYGTHLPGEIQGNHVHAIVCNILNEDMVYVVPITKVRTNITSHSYLFMDAPQDATYNDDYYKGGTVLVDKGKYIRAERFNYVIGKTTPEFFENLLYKLATTFDFTDYLNEAETSIETKETTDEVVETSVEVEETTENSAKTKTSSPKVGTEESALLEVIGFAFEKLDSSKKVEDQVESFLTDIGMTTTERMVTQSFIIACNIKKINYENVMNGLHENFPKVKKEIIKCILKEAFKNWLNKYPTLAKKCPKISLMAILKIFAKKFE